MKSLKDEYEVAGYIDPGHYYPNMSYQEVAASYNGMGAEWMGEFARKTLDAFFPTFRDPTIIHDVDYCRGITEDDRQAADTRYLRNMKSAIRHNIPWWRFRRRFLARRAAEIVFTACFLFGRSAFAAAKNTGTVK
jgi:hypothetical protein